MYKRVLQCIGVCAGIVTWCMEMYAMYSDVVRCISGFTVTRNSTIHHDTPQYTTVRGDVVRCMSVYCSVSGCDKQFTLGIMCTPNQQRCPPARRYCTRMSGRTNCTLMSKCKGQVMLQHNVAAYCFNGIFQRIAAAKRCKVDAVMASECLPSHISFSNDGSTCIRHSSVPRIVQTSVICINTNIRLYTYTCIHMQKNNTLPVQQRT